MMYEGRNIKKEVIVDAESRKFKACLDADSV